MSLREKFHFHRGTKVKVIMVKSSVYIASWNIGVKREEIAKDSQVLKGRLGSSGNKREYWNQSGNSEAVDLKTRTL